MLLPPTIQLRPSDERRIPIPIAPAESVGAAEAPPTWTKTPAVSTEWLQLGTHWEPPKLESEVPSSLLCNLALGAAGLHESPIWATPTRIDGGVSAAGLDRAKQVGDRRNARVRATRTAHGGEPIFFFFFS